MFYFILNNKKVGVLSIQPWGLRGEVGEALGSWRLLRLLSLWGGGGGGRPGPELKPSDSRAGKQRALRPQPVFQDLSEGSE